jgi:hypothetical protein
MLFRVDPNCLGSKINFRTVYYKPILEAQRLNAKNEELLRKVEGHERLNELKKKWILRRTKEIIKDQLPKKSIKLN